MELVIDKQVLLAAMALPARCIAPKSPQPIYGCMLIEAAADGQLQLTGSDGFKRATSSVAAKSVVRPGRCAADGRYLAQLIARLPDGDVKLSASDVSINVAAGKAKSRLPTRSPDDYPLEAMRQLGKVVAERLSKEPLDVLASAMDGSVSRVLPVEALREGLSVRYAASTDFTRTYLSCVWIYQHNGKLAFGASDSHRVAVHVTDVDVAGDLAVLVPATATADVAALLDAADGEVELITAPSCAFVRWSVRAGDVHTSFAHATTADKLLAFDKFVPTGKAIVARAGLAELVAAVRRAELAAPPEKGPMTMRLADGELLLSTVDPDRGELQDAVPVKSDGGSPVIGISSKYLREALASHVDDDVELLLGGDLDPVVIRSTARTSVIAPQRV